MNRPVTVERRVLTPGRDPVDHRLMGPNEKAVSGILAKARKIIIVGIFLLAAVLTPSADPVSQLLLAVPIYILFEISLFLARLLEKRKP